jgi:predicted MFS family arabinose efflux permease
VTVPLAYALGALTLAHVFAVAVAVGALTVGFDLSYSTYFVVVVPSEDIVDANSKLMTSRAASYVAGPSLAGVLVQVLTAPVALLVDAASFVGSALLIRRMKTPEPPAAEPGEPLRSRLAAGARFLFSQPVLRSGLACVTTVNFFNFAFAAEVVLFLARELDLSPGVIGLVFSVGALGALAGAVLAPRIGARIGYGPAVAAGCVLFSAPLLLFALAGGPRLVELAMLAAGELLSGVGVMVFDVNLNSIQALLTPHRLRGRVGGVFRTINYGVRPAGALVGGALGATIGLRPTLAIGAVGATLAVVFALARPLRTLRELPEAAA